jgi:hypothetical protein
MDDIKLFSDVSILELWTVYDHPLDFPDEYVARKFIDGKVTQEYFTMDDLEKMRMVMESKALFCVTRHPTDDPCIVETWL